MTDSAELDRLSALRSYGLLDSETEAPFEQIVALASKLFSAPIALISLVDEHRQWFKARVGLMPRETSREVAFCDHAIRNPEPMIVADATTDARFKENPLVTGDPNIRFYCGVPLRTPQGHGLGTLCIMDRVPRTLEPAEIENLARLAKLVEREFEVRRRLQLLERDVSDLSEAQRNKELLASMLIHDLRSPLTTISLLVSVLNGPLATPGVVAELLGAVDQMGRMLNDVLDICLGEAGRLRLRTQVVRPAELLEGASRAWRRLADMKSQRLVVDWEQAPASLTLDPELIGRVLTNLVENAVAYGPEGQTIAVTVRSGLSGATRFEVEDEAPPIPEDAVGTLFRPFERLRPETHPSRRGLGLAFCRLVAQAHSGAVGVVPGARGNMFFLDIPAPSALT